MKGYFADRGLAARPPVKRAAYSDRTAWIMAELSRLVYERLPPEISTARMVAEIRAAVDQGKDDDIIAALVRRAGDPDTTDQSIVERTLRAVEFELLDAFVKDGTEAFLARLNATANQDGMLVLVFRGTQPNARDVMTDIKFNLVSAPEGGRIHKGFHDAFELIHDQVKASLNKHAGLPLYLTGHSLGGALSTVATSRLASDSVGACYTFGSPRVADDEFFKHIKTPVYRVVNAADGVARVPFGYSISIVVSLLRLIPLSFMFAFTEWLRRHIIGYTHHGNLMFLNHVANIPDENGINFSGLKMRASPDFFWRATIVVRRITSTWGKAAASDHSISEYCQKLLAYAQRRNK